jgi:hypothetical protein
MARMGRYCKAYPVSRFRAYEAWTEDLENARKEAKQVDGKELQLPRTLTDDDYFYLQEDLKVTDGIFLDENIIFDDVTPEWERFCASELKFEVPVYEPIKTS